MKKIIIKKEVEVFDLLSFIKDCRRLNWESDYIVEQILDWACKCDGLIREEIRSKNGCDVLSDWCIKKEIEVEIPINELCTPFEKEFLSKVDEKYKNGYVARDKNGRSFIFADKPNKDVECEEWRAVGWAVIELPFSTLFPFITWEDEEPYKISDLIG